MDLRSTVNLQQGLGRPPAEIEFALNWGDWGLNPQLFSQPPNTLSNYVLGVSYILYT